MCFGGWLVCYGFDVTVSHCAVKITVNAQDKVTERDEHVLKH